MRARLLCAWCGRFLRWTVTTDGQPSHGICKECSRRVLIDAGLLIDDEQEGTMRENEIEYEYDEGARRSPVDAREREVATVTGQLALLRVHHGQAAVDEAVRRAATASTVRQR